MEKIEVKGEQIYLKKDILGWRIVHPVKNPDTGKINYPNLIFGGKRNLVMLIIILLLTLMISGGIKELISNYKDIAEKPCKYCNESLNLIPPPQIKVNRMLNLNLTNINISLNSTSQYLNNIPLK